MSPPMYLGCMAMAVNPSGPRAEQDASISRTLTGRFGGLTASTRAPAAGLWQDGGQTVRDDVVGCGVMVPDLSRA